jgi:tetratricopeptide (TPR) repeat protein
VVRQLSRELDQSHRLVRALGVRRDDELRLSRYRFQHSLIQRFLYHSLDLVERVYLHEAVGHTLEQLYADRAPEIAAHLGWHFELAQLPAKAAGYHAQAGDQARRSAALEEAIRAFQAALVSWPSSDLAGRAQLLRKLGEGQWVRGHLQDALATLEACYALYETLGDQEGAGAVQRLLGRLFWEMGDRERALRHYHRALALLEARPESVELAWAISSISQMHMLASEHDQSLAWGQRALEMAQRLNAEHVMIHALANMGNSSMSLGDAESGEAMLRHSWRRAVELNLPYDACRAAYNLEICLTDLGRYAEARPIVEELHAYATRLQIPMFAGMALIRLAKLDWLTGRWQSVLARRQQVLAWIAQSQSIGFLEVVADTTFAWVHNDLGQGEEARRLLDHALSKEAGRADIQTAGPQLGQRVRALATLGLDDAAAEAARRFLALIEQQQVSWDTTMPHLAVCRWLAGRAPALRAELGASLAQIERADAKLGSSATAAALSEGRGLAALAAQDAPAAADYLQRAADQWHALGRPFDQARALVDLGRSLALAGEAGGAMAALEQAQTLAGLLAAQLEDAEMHASFLGSPLMQQLHQTMAALAAPPDRASSR